jgi:hypothetical protein
VHGIEYDIVAWIRAADGGVADLPELAGKLGGPVQGLSRSSGGMLRLRRGAARRGALAASARQGRLSRAAQ